MLSTPGMHGEIRLKNYHKKNAAVRHLVIDKPQQPANVFVPNDC
jgi:hypothetical protein